MSSLALIGFVAIAGINTLSAQQKQGTALVDSLTTEVNNSKPDTNKVRLLVSLSDALIGVDPAKSMANGEAALALARELKWRKGTALAQRIIGKTYAQGLGKPEEAMTHLQPALETFRSIGWRKGEGLTLNNIGTAWYYQSETDSALRYWLQAQAVFQQLGDRAEEVKVQTNIGNAWSEKGNVDKAAQAYNDAILFNAAAGNKESESTARFNLAQLYKRSGALPKALDEFLKAYALCEEIGNKNGMARYLDQIADTYRLNDEPTKALEYSERAVSLARELGNKKIEQGAWLTKGMTHHDEHQYNEALNCYATAQVLGEATGDKRYIAMAFRNTGNVYADLNQHALALENHLKSLAITSNADNVSFVLDLDRVGQDYIALASTTDKSKVPDSLRNEKMLLSKAKKFLEEAVAVAGSTKQNVVAKNAHEALSRLYKQEGNWKNAHEHYLQYRALEDSIFSADSKIAIARLEARREAELKQKEIEIQKLELQAAQRERWYVIGGAALLLALVGVSFNRYRLQQRAKRTLEMERVRSRISRDLHDDIGSTLSSINFLTHSARKRLGDNDVNKTSEQLERIEDRTQRMLGNMRDIVWNIKPDNDSLDKLVARMEEYAVTTLDAKNITYKLSLPQKQIHLPLELKHNLYLIFKEAVNNLAKHSRCTRADISLTVDKNKLRLVVADNGVGTANETESGNGLVNMKRRAEEVGASLNIESKQGFGTRVEFCVSLTRTWDKAAKPTA